MRFCSLGSGSTGNATVVEAGDEAARSRILIDCGFSLRELDQRLGRAGLAASDLDAVFVTHEHGDHIGSAVALARRNRLPLWMSRGTWRGVREPDLPDLIRFARDGERIVIGALELHPFTVAHDAREPLQLRCSDSGHRLGVLTDAGSITSHLLENLQGCHALLLECNHDRALLAASRYPASLKARIGGRYGHLDNHTSAEILAACLHDGLQHLVAAHLSAENNRPELVLEALAGAWTGDRADVVIADPQRGFGWIAIG
ncbi:MAG: MBL fold metallo-hydrolase [Pseudomonadota bacterium]|nr:MBL fold metallo-hydrolase [Pseudomonadota bacterium]